VRDGDATGVGIDADDVCDNIDVDASRVVRM
jgi:hypothetical protein